MPPLVRRPTPAPPLAAGRKTRYPGRRTFSCASRDLILYHRQLEPEQFSGRHRLHLLYSAVGPRLTAANGCRIACWTPPRFGGAGRRAVQMAVPQSCGQVSHPGCRLSEAFPPPGGCGRPPPDSSNRRYGAAYFGAGCWRPFDGRHSRGPASSPSLFTFNLFTFILFTFILFTFSLFTFSLFTWSARAVGLSSSAVRRSSTAKRPFAAT
jgi:hypothetical protein